MCVCSRQCFFPFQNLHEILRCYNLLESQILVNYPLLVAKRIAETAFGIYSNSFRIFYSKIFLHLETATELVMASCLLCNLRRTLSAASYASVDYSDKILKVCSIIEE